MSRNCIAQTSDDEQAYRDPQTVEAVENPRKALPRRGSSRTLLLGTLPVFPLLDGQRGTQVMGQGVRHIDPSGMVSPR